MPKSKNTATSNAKLIEVAPYVTTEEENDIKKAVASKVARLHEEADKLVRRMILLTGEVGWVGALKKLAREIECRIANVALRDAGIGYSITIIDSGARILGAISMGDKELEFVDGDDGNFLPLIQRVDKFEEWSVYKMADDLERVKDLLERDIADLDALREFVEVWEPRLLNYLEFNADPLRKRADEVRGLVIGC